MFCLPVADGLAKFVTDRVLRVCLMNAAEQTSFYYSHPDMYSIGGEDSLILMFRPLVVLIDRSG